MTIRWFPGQGRLALKNINPSSGLSLESSRPSPGLGMSSFVIPIRESTAPAFRMSIADRTQARCSARSLAYEAYRERGYTEKGAFDMLIAYLESRYRVFSLLATDVCRAPSGTISLLFDENYHLPCDQIFENEVNGLRSQGRKLVEVTLLAIQPRHSCSRELLVGLFNLIYLYAYRVQGHTDFLIEVNPRHANYYRKLLGFEPMGPERPCPRVKGAPAVLLRLDLSHPFREIERIRHSTSANNRSRSLYPFFFSQALELKALRFLEGSAHDDIEPLINGKGMSKRNRELEEELIPLFSKAYGGKESGDQIYAY